MASSVAIAGRVFTKFGQLLTVESVLRKDRIAVKFCTALAEQARSLRLAACICERENMNAPPRETHNENSNTASIEKRV